MKYEGAGTMEFLYENEEFFFIEMNTRIQVEHTVTEMITGVDLVQSQLLVALEGEFNLNQEDLKINGCAMQCRINAEDPETFIPSQERSPKCTTWWLSCRFESQIYSGYEIPPNYDSLIAEIIVKDTNRERVINKMRMALNETIIYGINTNVDLHKKIIEDKNFHE